MSDLGDLLELLYTARRSWTTVTATVRTWTHRERSEAAFLRFAEGQRRAGAVIGIRGAGRHHHDPPLPDVIEARSRVWIAGPDRVRVEPEGVGPVPIQRRVASVNGRPVALPEPNPLDDLLDPSGLLAVADLRIEGTGEVAGRPVVLVEATLRDEDPRGPLRLHGLRPGADRHLLAVDAGRGVLLRTEAVYAGEPFAVTEVTAISFDDVLPDDLFASRQPPPEVFSPPEAVSVEEAARRAPFTVLVPTRLPERATLSVRLMAAAGPRPFLVHLSYHLPASLHHVEVIQSSAADAAGDGTPWTEEHHGGRQLWVWEPAGAFRGAGRQVKIVHEGTVVRIVSDLDMPILREMALSLAPAPTEPPTLA